MKKFLQIVIVVLAIVGITGCSTFHGNVPSPGKTVVAQETGYAGQVDAFKEVANAKPLPPALVHAKAEESSTMVPVPRSTKTSTLDAIKTKLNGKKVVKKTPKKAEKKKVLSNEELTAYVKINRYMISQNAKAIEELSLMVVLNRYMIKHGHGVIVPLRYYFNSGGSNLGEVAKNDLDLLCTLSKEGGVEVMLIEGYSDDVGSYKKNADLTWQRVDSALARLKCQDGCADLEPLTAAYAETNFQGSKENNRSVIVYVKVLKKIDMSKFGGKTIPAESPKGPKSLCK
ncbi:MAG: hypothetical protein U9Q85_01410 [Patescibacteria group bacterium]|nr:hypothetical protein [Patescibacteria group bacterium]